jgi:hypothetical protein
LCISERQRMKETAAASNNVDPAVRQRANQSGKKMSGTEERSLPTARRRRSPAGIPGH